MFVYPRVPTEVASSLYDALLDSPLEALRDGSSTSHPAAGYYATGSRVPEQRLARLQTEVRSLVDSLGFPEPTRRQSAFSKFDHELPEVLFESMDIVPSDAADEGVWSFIGLVLLPDVAVWRYPARSRERIVGLQRNAFKRLWWRGYVLGAKPDNPPAVLGEDQLVAVMERPTIGGNPRLARAFCAAVIHAQQSNPDRSPMFIMRESAKRLMRLTPFVCADAISKKDLDDLVTNVVQHAVASLDESS